MSFLKRLFCSPVEQAMEVDAALSKCQLGGSSNDCSLIKQLQAKQAQKRDVDAKIKSYEDHSQVNIPQLINLLLEMEKKGFEMCNYDHHYPFGGHTPSSIRECFKYSFGTMMLETILDDMSESDVEQIGCELKSLKTRASIVCDLRRQSTELNTEIATIKSQLGIE